jgi:DNA-binding SARP family transcriptional activator/tetratricopeptide (TPR) repeat protein
MLELFLLGSPTLLLNGKEVRVKTRKALVLMALLALEGEQSRDRVSALFWADAGDAKNSLRNALSSLRETFGAHLIADRSTVRLRVDACDALSVLQGDLSAALEYRGALLDGVTLPDAPEAEEWLELARRRVEAAATRTLEGLGSLEALEKLSGLDGLNEHAERRLMETLAQSGQRERALEVFERFRARLESALGVAPMPETLSLADSLRLEVPAVRSGRVPSLPSLLLESRLVGRVAEFQRLVTGFHAAAQGQPGVVLLSGEPGIGKTRLAQEFLSWAGARGGVTLQARAFEGGALAYQSVTDVLRLVSDLPSLLTPVWLAELGRLLPELHELPDLPAPVSDEALGRSRIFEAVSRLMSALTRRGTLVWLLDDAQWADAASLEVLGFVTRRAAFDRLPVLFVLTARTEGLPGLQTLLSNLRRELPLTQLEVSPLSHDDTARFLDGLGLPLEPLLERLYAETGGQPLFLSETLRSLSETGALFSSGGAWRVNLEGNLSIAPGVKAVIEARFSRLSGASSSLLEAGAILGQGFTLEDALRVSGVVDGVTALEELLRSRVLLETSGVFTEATRYTFSHDKLRETALQGLSDAKAQALHQRALERVHGSLAQRAAHAFSAHDWTRAARFSLQAAEQASQAYAWRDAWAHLERARALLVSKPVGTKPGLGLTSRELSQIYGLLIQHLRILGENDEGVYIRLAQEAVRLAQERGDPHLEIEALLFHDNALPFDETRSRALLDRAEAVFRGLGDEVRVFSLEIERADFARLHPDTMRQAIAHLETLVPRGRALGRDQLGRVLSRLADFNQSHGDWRTAVRWWREEIAVRADEPMDDNTAFRLENLGFSLTNCGELDEALVASSEAHRIKQRIDDNPTWTGMAGAYLSYALVETGALEEALSLTREAHALREAAITRFAAEYAFAHAHVLLETNPAAARSALCETYPRFRDDEVAETNFSAVFWVTQFRDFFESHLCASYALEGDWMSAAIHARNAFRARQERHNWRGYQAPRLRHWLEVEALVRVGDRAAAERVVRHLEDHVGQDEPLTVNLALARYALDGSGFAEALNLARGRGWTLRVGWLEARVNPQSF